MLQAEYTETDEIVYCYDSNGTLIGFTYEDSNGKAFYRYVFNLQGDVIAIPDANYNVVVQYTYDTWGKVLSVTGSLASTIGQRNPIRYRGYYYDVETGLYYLQTRYYDPDVGRFVNMENISVGIPSNTVMWNKSNHTYNNIVDTNSNSIDYDYVVEIGPFLYNTNYTIKNIHNSNFAFDNNINKDIFLPTIAVPCDLHNMSGPVFFSLTNTGFELISFEYSFATWRFFLDNNNERSLYISHLNVVIYAGFNTEKDKYGIELGGSVESYGYDGKYIDISIDFLTAKFFFCYENGKFNPDLGFGLIDIGISFDLMAIKGFFYES